MKILCIYALHERTLNVDFFIKHGIVDDPDVDYYFVINNPHLSMEVPGCTVINRENKNFDFGAWSHVLFSTNSNSNYLYQDYDYFVFINSSVRGPFYPVWYKEQNWIRLFINQVTDELKLFGTTIGTVYKSPHVQSMVMATDRSGLEIGIKNRIFVQDEPQLTLLETIHQKEVRFSTVILNAGYNIGCMLRAYNGVDFRKDKRTTEGVFKSHEYYGMNVHPYEVIFPKISTKNLTVEENIYLVDHYTNWASGPDEHKSFSFDWVHYILQHPDLLEAGISNRRSAFSHYRYHGKYEQRSPNTNSAPRYYKDRFKSIEDKWIYKPDLFIDKCNSNLSLHEKAFMYIWILSQLRP
jgi:hypothetical protein